MSKFYEVSKVLDKRTDAHGRVQYLVKTVWSVNHVNNYRQNWTTRSLVAN